MASTGLPPPPINDAPGSFTWLEWYRQLRNYISTSGSVPWYIINFADSNLSDIQNKDHNILDNLQGGSAGERYHLTAAQHALVGDGEHNDLQSIQGGTPTERYHLTELGAEFVNDAVTNDNVKISKSITLETAEFKLVPDPNTPGSVVLEIDSSDGIILKSPYIVIDTTNPQLTMPGAQIGSLLVVAGFTPTGNALLGYQAPVPPAYSVQASTQTPVVIKAAGTAPPTAWVSLGLSVTLTQDLPAGQTTALFSMPLTNPTSRTGVLEFGMRVNGTILSRDIVLQIPANYLSTAAMSIPLVSGYVAGDVIELVARVTQNNNNQFSLTMNASPTEQAVFRLFT